MMAIDDGRLTERSILAADLVLCDELAVVNDLRGWRPARLATTQPAAALICGASLR